MQLVIAEKPSVARDLARVLGVRASGRNALEGPERVITWCIGHLVELEEPAAYDPRWKAWRMGDLPMLPAAFKLRPVARTRDQLRIVCDLLRDRRFSEVVNGCDAGREGELIFRYVYELARSRLTVRRLWISSLTDEAIRQGFAALRPGSAYQALADAARCRSEADWLVGMNATRAVTIQFRATAGGRGGTQAPPVYSIGRVQTPTLAILVRREQAIRAFQPRDYWEVRGTFACRPASTAAVPGDAPTFTALWTAPAAPHKGSVPLTRIGVRALAAQVVARATAGAQGGGAAGAVVESLTQKQSREPPPQLFDLTSLQRTANRRFGFSATRTLEAAQALYERHKVLTYPRTDSRHLPPDMADELPKLFAGLAKTPAYAPFATPLLGGDLKAAVGSRRIFDAGKVHDHHAIVPTGKVLGPGALGADEQRIFELVARRFLGVFYPDAVFALTEAVIRVGDARDGAATAPQQTTTETTTETKKGTRAAATDAGAAPASAAGTASPTATAEEDLLAVLPPPPDRFIARGRVRLVAGWQAVAGLEPAPVATSPRTDRGIPPGVARGPGGDPARDAPSDGADALLPPLSKGERLSGTFEAVARQTRPPPRHTEATLLGAMESAGREIADEALRAAMRDTGLGTPATRAATIETLVKRGFISRNGKQVVATATGIGLIERLPVPTLASPELTGSWEARLVRVARGQDTRAAFMTDIARYVREVTDAVRGAMHGSGGPQRAPHESRSPDVVAVAEPLTRARRARAVVPRGAAPAQRPGKGPAKLPVKIAKSTPAAPLSETPPLACPRCHEGTLMAGHRGWGCSRWREGCPFVIWFAVAGKRITEVQLRDLVNKGKTRAAKWAWAPTATTGEQAGHVTAAQGTSPVRGRLILDLSATREQGAARFTTD